MEEIKKEMDERLEVVNSKIELINRTITTFATKKGL